MKKMNALFLIFFLVILLVSLSGCSDAEDKEPIRIQTENQILTDTDLHPGIQFG